MDLKSPLRLTPFIQRYAWGDPQTLPQLLRVKHDGAPWAEAWFGAHPAGPARAAQGAQSVPLDELVRREGARLVGDNAWERYAELPYLLKLLTCAKPLSIQVHPSRAQAMAGFDEEEAQGIPRDAKDRCYRDPNHKPEVLVAWTEFFALAGFRSGEALTSALAQVPELTKLLPPLAPGPTGLRALVEAYFALPRAALGPELARVVLRLEEENRARRFLPHQPQYWALKAHHELSPEGEVDRGLLFVFLLDLVRLEPGEALALPPGVPHAYLEGTGLELMANSDNVLRAGLTPKHIAVNELLKVVRFDAAAPPKLVAVENESGIEASYAIAAEELQLLRLRVGKATPLSRRANGAETLLVKHGSLRVVVGERDLELGPGSACLIPAGLGYQLVAKGDAEIFVASTPDSEPAPGRFRGQEPAALAFGTSGLRGLVADITDLEAYLNTRGFLDTLMAQGETVPGGNVAIGGDLRPSTERILRAVASAIRNAGLSPIYCGRLPTPALSYYAFQAGWPSIMVTGSHIPFDRNGIKFNKTRGEVLKDDEDAILRAVSRVRRREYHERAGTSLFDDAGAFKRPPPPLAEASPEAQALYLERYLTAFPRQALAGLKVGLFEHSAVGRELVRRILEELGAQVYPIGRAESFVAIDTEAIAEERLVALRALARQLTQEVGPIDALVSTDGDSDRPMLLGFDELGELCFFGGDILGLVVAEMLGADAIAVPVSSSDAIEQHFEPRGVTIARTRIGSPWVIAQMTQLEGARRVGWEANGGFLVGSRLTLDGGALEPLPTRDAVLPLVAALYTAKQRGVALWELFAALPQRHSRAGLLDDVDPDQSRLLSQRFGLTRWQARSASFTDSGPILYSETGQPRRPSEQEVAEVLDMREGLESLFSKVRGFDRLQHIDTLDGLRLSFAGGDIAHVRPSGNAPQLRIYAVANSSSRAEAIVADALKEPDGLLRTLLSEACQASFTTAILHNIQVGVALFERGTPPQVVGVVCGSPAAQTFWQGQLDAARSSLGAERVESFHEDLPVNQAFGLLLLWQRLKPRLKPGDGALIAFVFGEGTRATPLTEAECGQKPALASFVVERHDGRRAVSIVELALRSFAPVEDYLRRSGFSGMVVKWGDEVQIPTLDLSGTDARFANADVVRFVSLRRMTDDDARNKDWLGVDAEGRITAFIPRRPLSEMEALADRGLLQKRAGQLYGGVNLGSVALSRVLLDALLEEFASDVNDATAKRSERPDLDPQLFTALTVAVIADQKERQAAWLRTLSESATMRKLVDNMPDVLVRLRRALDRFEATHGRPVCMRALDFGDQYWGDVGQHQQMHDLYMALGTDSVEGRIARALAGLDDAPDADGNWLVGDTQLGPAVNVKNSVLIDARVDSGRIDGCVLIGTHAKELVADRAFDVESRVVRLELGPRAGSYKVVSESNVVARPGERLTTVFLDDGDELLRVHETTDLRDRAHHYDQPILGNAVSFNEAHAQVILADPARLEARRIARRGEVEAAIAIRRTPQD